MNIPTVYGIQVSTSHDPEAEVNCERLQDHDCAVLHFGACSVFPSDQQLIKLTDDIRRYLDSRLQAPHAEATAR